MVYQIHSLTLAVVVKNVNKIIFVKIAIVN